MSLIREILSSPTREANQAMNLLSRLYRSMLYNLNITYTLFDHSLTRYLNDPRNPIYDNPKAKMNYRGNLMKEVASPKMTWDVFNKGLLAIGVTKYEIEIILKHRNVFTQEMMYTSHKVCVDNLFNWKSSGGEKARSFKELLSLDEVNISASGNTITRLYRTILMNLRVNAKNIETYMSSYLSNPYNSAGDTTKKRGNHRGNLLKELNENRMTWEVFNKGLRVLGVVEFEFIIRPTIVNSVTKIETTTEHRMVNDFGNDIQPTTVEVNPDIIREGFTNQEGFNEYGTSE